MRGTPEPPETLTAAVRRQLLAWSRAHSRELPWRNSPDPYAILLSEVMLQQTQVARVLPKYHEFLKRYPTVQQLAEAPVRQVIAAWAPLGYNLRALRLHRAAQELVRSHGGQVPADPDVLRSLPGIGGYSAAAIACFAYGVQVPVVDTNVRRVLSRVFFGAVSPAATALARTAKRLVPPGRARAWNLALMDLGATVCTSRRPRCAECLLEELCAAAPALNAPTKRLAEEKAPYRVRPQPFKGSRRYFRGRVVQALREAPDGEGLALSDLGRAVKEGFGDEDTPWLWGLVQELARDGLVATWAGPSPGGHQELGQVVVALPGSGQPLRGP